MATNFRPIVDLCRTMKRFLRCYFSLICLAVNILAAIEDGTKTFSPNAENPFRIQKLNFILAKARQRLSQADLKSLFLDFRKLDIEFLEAKQMRGEGKDPEGALFRQAEKHLSQILAEHGFSDVLGSLDAIKANGDGTWAASKHLNSVYDKIDGKEFEKDKKLNKLWNRALDSGFTEEELLGLKEELIHHQKKLDAYDKMAAQLGKDYHENSVKYQTEDERLEEKRKLKSERKQIEEDLKLLSERIHSEDRVAPFSHPRVKVLWQNALSSGSFSEKELESLKEELMHFQSRLEKLEFFKRELEGSEKNLKKAGKDHLKSPEHADHEQKLKHFAYKVDKLERYLQSRIMHSEL